jgi:hypothetical protein
MQRRTQSPVFAHYRHSKNATPFVNPPTPSQFSSKSRGASTLHRPFIGYFFIQLDRLADCTCIADILSLYLVERRRNVACSICLL